MIEQKKKKESLEEYLSFIRHELRNQLFVVREGISQAVDGLGGKDCAKCAKILQPSLEYADNLNKSIGEMLNNASFELILKKTDNDKSETKNLEISKEELMVIINHMIRTPLTIMKEGLSLVLDEIPGNLNFGQKKYLNAVKENTDNLIVSIEKILLTPLEKMPSLLGEDVQYKTGDKKV
jgi:K+-sensing histidine kinase KdpD